MAELFQRNKSTISRHINNAFEEGELTPEATVAFFATVQKEGFMIFPVRYARKQLRRVMYLHQNLKTIGH